MPERERFLKPEDRDFHNEDYMMNVMENGSEEEVAALKKFFAESGVEEKEIENRFHYAKLRRSIIEADRAQLEERLKTSSEPTEEELDLGGYAENIESPARSAVFAMRKKGYNTYESGFWGNSQKISFRKDTLEKFTFEPEFLEKMAAKGAKIRLTKKSIIFHLDNLLDAEGIKEVWDEIAEAMPDLGHKAGPADVQTAVEFRKKFSDKHT